MITNYRGWSISYRKTYHPGPPYTAKKGGETLQGTSRVDVERAVDTREDQIASENKSLGESQFSF